MIEKYHTLPHYDVEHGAKISPHTTKRASNVSLDNSALTVMTDLREAIPFTIEPTATIDATNAKMIANGVRLLFVTDSEENLLGIVTYSDLWGAAPVRYMKEHGGTRADIIVRDIMTVKDRLNALRYEDVSRASVGDIIQTMNILGRQHTLVTETTDRGNSIIRGIFSTSQIARQVGLPPEPKVRASTFADVKQAVVSA
ncbi:MAG: CBS domain-containing protein [Gammaproteobacteria bacterium]|jgi:CBS domain-containing protein